jgi:hypothetical protein
MLPPAMNVKPSSAKHRPATGTAVSIGREPEGDSRATVRFGDVVVTARRPTEAEVQRNVELGSAALARALPRLARPGVRIYPKKDVPLFWVDPENPGGFIRKLNGKLERGVLEDGQFKPTD